MGVILAIFCSAAAQEGSQPGLSSPEMIKADLTTVPCSESERLQAVKDLFLRMGAEEKDFVIEKSERAQNLIVRKPGQSASAIVIGAHYDKVADGCGAVDNWTGIVAIAHVFRALKDVPLQKSITFVAFGAEEKGLRGSRAMVRAIDQEELNQYCAMINIDSLGLALPQALDNTSSKKMIHLATAVAKEMKIAFNHASVGGADADSSSFLARKIPAVTIHGLSRNWATILHTRNDQVSRIKLTNVYLGYRLALAILLKVDQSGCEDFREP